MSDEKLGLAEVIAQVRHELTRSIAMGNSHSAVWFDYQNVEVEFEIAVAKEAGGGGGVNVWVISAQGQAKQSNTTTHRVKVSMKPFSPTTGRPLGNRGAAYAIAAREEAAAIEDAAIEAVKEAVDRLHENT
jgi:hypothetical protein